MRNTALLCVLAAALSGCSTQKVNLGEGPREYVATDYETVLRKWTRNTQLINMNELDNVLTVTATYESWDFRWAYVVRYSEDYRLTVDQRQALLEQSLTEARASHQFYIALYAQRYKWSELKTKDPAWIVRLVDDEGSETAPTDIEPIKRPGAIDRTYFPYTSPWRLAYRVRFPIVRPDGRPTISPDARWIGLRFAGAQGNDQLVWELAEPGSQPRFSKRDGPGVSPPRARAVAER
jgi:hypothetical protein